MKRLRGIRRLWLAGVVAAASLTPGTGAAGVSWKTYRNGAAGFAINYPAGWTAHVRRQAGSNLDVVFLVPGQSSGVNMAVRPPLPRYTTEPNDNPDTSCHGIAARGIRGMYCLIAPSSTAITTFVTRSRAYRVTASLHQVNRATYRAMVRSFRLLS
jgi:hypothetical protein